MNLNERWDPRGGQAMNGIAAAFTGRIGRVRTARDGKTWAFLPCGDARQDRRRGPGDMGADEVKGRNL